VATTQALSRPQALLLDFGGVLADAPGPPVADPQLIRALHERGAGPGDPLSYASTRRARAPRF
jgi:hypothetical protein